MIVLLHTVPKGRWHPYQYQGVVDLQWNSFHSYKKTLWYKPEKKRRAQHTHLRILLGTDAFMYLLTFVQLTPEIHDLWYPDGCRSMEPTMSKIHCLQCNLNVRWFLKRPAAAKDCHAQYWSHAEENTEARSFYCCQAHFFEGMHRRLEKDEQMTRHKLTNQFVAWRRDHAELLLLRVRLARHR